MRRTDREIKSFDEIIDVLGRCDTIRLGISGEDGFPYIVPLSFGYEIIDERVVVYFHGAKAGLKHDLIVRDNRVCVEADICHGFKPIEDTATTEYESVIGFGLAQKLDGAQARRGLELVMAHCGFENANLPAGIENSVFMYAVTLERITGKRRFVK